MADVGSGSATSLEPIAPRRHGRGDLEFGRSLAYVDATFAIATTLLVTTLAPGKQDWSSWADFSESETLPLAAFALSFVVISAFWWAHHRLVSTLDALTSRFVIASIGMLAFVVLVPFTTEGLGEYSGDIGVVSTVVYALNIAAVSIGSISLFVIAHRDGLFRVPLTPRGFRLRLLELGDTPVVFLASIPIAIYVSPGSARAFWALLIVTGNTIGRIVRRIQA